jgi:maltose O-acetyltransferase
MKALREVGGRRLLRFVLATAQLLLWRCAIVPPLRTWLLRAFGVAVGPGSIVQRCVFINADRTGFRGLSIGRDCFIGDEVLLDLAAPIVLGHQVTLAARAMVLTHLNVGYKDHPLQEKFPARTAGVTINEGSFVGAGAIVLCGLTIGTEAFVGAATLVNRDVPAGSTVAGVPARAIDARDARERRIGA